MLRHFDQKTKPIQNHNPTSIARNPSVPGFFMEETGT
jgi:hypothetical protein